MIVYFCGHKNTNLSFKEKSQFSIIIKKLLILYPNCNFYLGGYGNFDNYCLQYLHKLKQHKYPNIKSEDVESFCNELLFLLGSRKEMKEEEKFLPLRQCSYLK